MFHQPYTPSPFRGRAGVGVSLSHLNCVFTSPLPQRAGEGVRLNLTQP